MAAKGIDVSTFQGEIDWAAVKRSGVSFAMIKATQGRAVSSDAYLFTDSRFVRNITQASQAGIECGVYHYLTARTVSEAVKEAEYFTRTILPYKPQIKLWAAVDVEEDKYLPTNDRALLTSIVKTFVNYVKTKGFEPMVYTNPSYLKYRLNSIGGIPLWLALWRDVNNVPQSYPDMKLWQYGKGSVSGIVTDVDLNLGFYADDTEPDYAQLVCDRCGLESQTREFIDGYRYADDLWRKLWLAME